ncbi:MAG: pyridoxamine 5-phosphate oxidase-related,FMN-binding protein [Frankiales bacterium]|nr:pyridoxamine 5-phosphate oxidase-related,FMN-binding protein [Frankiales bacterium]
MRMDSEAARGRFADSRSARLASAAPSGQPHLVPIVFAVVGDVIYTAVDAKPKSGGKLRRLANIEANPQVSVLVDHYDDDWDQLWWARADGTARVLEPTSNESAAAITALTARYRQYEADPPPGPVVAITAQRWSGWTFRAGAAGPDRG